MSSERHTYPGRPSHCPGALRDGGGRVQHGGPVPTADIVREYVVDGVTQRTVLANAAGLCSSCGALEQLDREQRRRTPEDSQRGGRRGQR